MSLACISHPDCCCMIWVIYILKAHALKVIDDEIIKSGLSMILKPYLAPLATREQLLRVHSKEYVDHIFKISPQHGFVL